MATTRFDEAFDVIQSCRKELEKILGDNMDADRVIEAAGAVITELEDEAAGQIEFDLELKMLDHEYRMAQGSAS